MRLGEGVRVFSKKVIWGCAGLRLGTRDFDLSIFDFRFRVPIPNLSTSSSSIGIILDISLHLDNLEGSLNLEVLRWLKLLQVPYFECLGLADLLIKGIGLSQGRAKTETKQGGGDVA